MGKNDWEIENELRKMKQLEMVTELKKDKFIDEIKTGLGEQIRKEPNKIQEKPKKPNLIERIKKVFK